MRSVTGSPANGYHFKSDQYTAKACDVFADSPDEVQRMTDYASRNWTNCDYAGHRLKCNLSYHFADVNIHEHSDYMAAYFGAEPYDVVHAIEAAEVVLRCKTGQTCAVPAEIPIRLSLEPTSTPSSRWRPPVGRAAGGPSGLPALTMIRAGRPRVRRQASVPDELPAVRS